MPIKELAKEAKKNPVTMVPSGKAENMVEAGAAGNRVFEKKDVSYRDSEIKGLVPGQRTFGSRQNFDEKHGSIIRNISSASDMNRQISNMGVSWEECKHRKSSLGADYCAEYHSRCYKDKCKRARK